MLDIDEDLIRQLKVSLDCPDMYSAAFSYISLLVKGTVHYAMQPTHPCQVPLLLMPACA